jgi:hypothetical protein
MQYNTVTKTITINQSFNLSDKIKSEYTAELNNMPEDAEILNIDNIKLCGAINNLPSTLREINIKCNKFYYSHNLAREGEGLVFPLSCGKPEEIKELLKKIFSKRPYLCKFYLID